MEAVGGRRGYGDCRWLLEDVIVQGGVELSPEYDVILPVALLWSEDHKRLNGALI